VPKNINIVGFDISDRSGHAVRFLLEGFNISQYSFNDDPGQIDNPLIVYHKTFEDGSSPIGQSHVTQEVLDFCSGLKTNFMLFHMSNEFNYYNYYPKLLTMKLEDVYPKCAHVFRHEYWNPSLDIPGITHLPVLWYLEGYKKQLTPVPKEDKKYKTCFVGGIKQDRAEAIYNMEALGDCFLHHQSGWLSDDMIQPVDVQKIYSESVLCPNPHGNCHPTTYRIAEILQSGSIPVLREYYNRDYHYKIYGEDSPLPFVKDWSELPMVYDMVCEYGIEEYSQKIYNWWVDFKVKLRKDFQQIILGI